MAAWDTDITLDSATVLSGDSSIKFESTTPAADPFILGPWVPVDKGVGGSSLLNRYGVTVVAQASSITAGNYIKVELIEYEADMETVTATTTIISTELAATGTWQALGGFVSADTDSRFLRVKVSKKNTAFTANVDRVDVERLARQAIATRASSTQTLGTATWETAELNVASSGGGVDFDTSSHSATILSTGVYELYAAAYISSHGSGDAIGLRFKQTKFDTGSTVYHPCYWLFAGSTSSNTASMVSGSYKPALEPGDTIELEAYVQSGGLLQNATLQGISLPTRMVITKIN